MDGWMDRLKTIFARGVITNYTHFIKTPLKKKLFNGILKYL